MLSFPDYKNTACWTIKRSKNYPRSLQARVNHKKHFDASVAGLLFVRTTTVTAHGHVGRLWGHASCIAWLRPGPGGADSQEGVTPGHRAFAHWPHAAWRPFCSSLSGTIRCRSWSFLSGTMSFPALCQFACYESMVCFPAQPAGSPKAEPVVGSLCKPTPRTAHRRRPINHAD